MAESKRLCGIQMRLRAASGVGCTDEIETREGSWWARKKGLNSARRFQGGEGVVDVLEAQEAETGEKDAALLGISDA